VTRSLSGVTRSLSGVAAARVWGVLTAAAGSATLVVASRPRLPGRERVPRLVVGVLGARQVMQGSLVMLAPTSDMVKLAIAVEVVHGSSMLPVAAWPRYRRPALLAAGQAALFALAGRAALAALRS
jgi:hypothetical protein